jgi:glycosyltransferase involved in cell wall biosynthesis
MHATEFDRTGYGQINQSIYAIERKGVRDADRVVAVSGYTKNMVAEKYDIPESKIEVVHNGIDADDAVVVVDREQHVHSLKKYGNSIVLFVGRLTLQKGPDYFLRIAKRVLEQKKDVVFVISGSGDMEKQIINQAAYLGISDRVLFVGFLRNHALARMYAMADLVVMPSVSEPFGIVPLEALLNGTPVLLSKQSGVREVVKNALVADFWDIDEMANSILAVISHHSLKETLVEGGRREAQNMQWRQAAQKCIMVYKQLLSPSMQTI